jgi:hypothetical protein
VQRRLGLVDETRDLRRARRCPERTDRERAWIDRLLEAGS